VAKQKLNLFQFASTTMAEPGASGQLCHLAGGELEQIQFLLGHASVETTESYLNHAVNDNLGVEDT